MKREQPTSEEPSVPLLKGPAGGCVAVTFGTLLLLAGCGFGLYDGSSAPQVVDSNDGVWDAGQWWPWACQLPDGTFSNPAPPSTPITYAASGSCGDGGPFALSVNGCEMFGNWEALGLSGVTTAIPSSIPQAGGWEIEGTGSFDVGDGGTAWTCDARATDSSGDLTVTCSAGVPVVTACESALRVVTGS